MRCYYGHGLPSSFPFFLKRKPGESRLLIAFFVFCLPAHAFRSPFLHSSDPPITYSFCRFFPTPWCLSDPFRPTSSHFRSDQHPSCNPISSVGTGCIRGSRRNEPSRGRALLRITVGLG